MACPNRLVWASCQISKLAHAPEMFSPPPRVKRSRHPSRHVRDARRECFPRLHGLSDPDIHHGTCVTHVPWCMPGSLTGGFLWSRWRGNRSQRMRNVQFYASGKRPMVSNTLCMHSTLTVKLLESTHINDVATPSIVISSTDIISLTFFMQSRSHSFISKLPNLWFLSWFN